MDIKHHSLVISVYFANKCKTVYNDCILILKAKVDAAPDRVQMYFIGCNTPSPNAVLCVLCSYPADCEHWRLRAGVDSVSAA